jgi:tetratricopeptide (TPR) repeat protein
MSWPRGGWTLVARGALVWAVFLSRGFAAASSPETLETYMVSVAARVTAEPPPALPHFDNRLTRLLVKSQTFAEAGRYREAADAIRQLQAAPPLPDVILSQYIEEWTRERLAALKILQRRVDVISLRALYVDAKPYWFKQRLHPIVAAWRAPAPDEASRLRLMADLFERAGDAHGEWLALLALLSAGTLGPNETAKALLEAGDRADDDKQHTIAITSWERVVRDHSGTSEWFKALLNLGAERRAAGRYLEAIHHFTRLIEAQAPRPESTAHPIYRDLVHRAADQLSKCYEATGNIPAALQWAQLASGKYRLDASCGVGAEAREEAVAARIARLKSRIR